MTVNMPIKVMLKKLGSIYTFKRITKTADTTSATTTAYGEIRTTETTIQLLAMVVPAKAYNLRHDEIRTQKWSGIELLGIIDVYLPKDTVIKLDDHIVTQNGEYAFVGVADRDSFLVFEGQKV